MRYKIIITGPVGAGKTTAINSLTDDKSVKTDVPVSDQTTSKRKLTTTVALDYGVVRLNDDDVAHVYGTPGQERFDFMWEILSEGAHALIILLDNSRNYPFRDLKFYTDQFSALIARTGKLIIGVTRNDVKSTVKLDAYRAWVNELNLDCEVLDVDARNKFDVHMLVTRVLESGQIVIDTLSDILPVENASPMVSTETSVDLIQGEALAVDSEATSAVRMRLTSESIAAIEKIKSVKGVSLANDMGEVLDSNIDDEEINEFIAFISGITPDIQESLGMGEIHRIMLRGPVDDNLTVFVEEERSLGVLSDRKASVPALSQQIEDMLQWL